MTEKPMAQKPKPKTRWIVGAVVLGILAIVAIGFGAAKSIAATQEAEHVGEQFWAALKRNDVDAAYALLSTKRRAAMTRDAFAALTDHAVFRRHEEINLRPPKEFSPGQCAYGTATLDGKAWAVEIFLVRDPDKSIRVESFAIQPPADPRLGVLLEECGLTAATRTGYSGPPLERTTAKLAL